ncbi:MAG: DUF502 domain-containing protein [Alphaproteobacteria bacterium]|jgi:uncharacterized membrane protein|nr:DUF502 domain-containing protein [Alphaproteobacteria bacterium]
MKNNQNSGNTIINRIKNYFFTGVIVAAPVTITIYMSYHLVLWINEVTKRLIPQQWKIGDFVPYAVPGLGLVLLLLLLLFIGMLTTGYIGKFFVRLGERIIRKMPVISSIYSLLKQIFETFLSQKSRSFNEVVLVEYPRKGLWSIAFVSNSETGGEIDAKSGQKTLSIFVPTTPNPTSGFLIFVPEKDVIKLDMSVEDGIKYVISCGIVTPGTNNNED